MSKALFVPLQLSLGAFVCFSTTPTLAEARLALGEETSPSFLAQVTPDGTVNTQVTQDDNSAVITGGETRGGNLFHSFQDFSVPTGNEAFFNNADSISNIFSRVTGGNISNIDGAIRANGTASLFLINPAEIIFGGNLSISTDKLVIRDRAALAVGNFQIVFEDLTPRPPGSGSPGTLNIEANSLELTNQGRIDAATQAETGEGAIVNLQIADNITFRNNSFISAQAFGNADGGNLTIDTNFIIAFPNQMAGNGNDIIANAVDGDGGNISINAESLLGIREGRAIGGNETNDIDARGGINGLDGTVAISTPDVNPVQGATELSTDVIEPGQTTQQICQANREALAEGGLTIEGKGGILPEPGSPLNSLNVIVNGESTSAKAIPAPIETSQGKIQPARGVEITESGEVILTAYRTDNSRTRIPEIKPNCS